MNSLKYFFDLRAWLTNKKLKFYSLGYENEIYSIIYNEILNNLLGNIR